MKLLAILFFVLITFTIKTDALSLVPNIISPVYPADTFNLTIIDFNYPQNITVNSTYPCVFLPDFTLSKSFITNLTLIIPMIVDGGAKPTKYTCAFTLSDLQPEPQPTYGGGRRVKPKPIIKFKEPEKPIYTIFCGDGNCTKGENCSNCARDCGECEIEISEPYCIDGDLRCADGTLLICKNESWEIEKICECETVDEKSRCVKKSPIGLKIAIPLMILVIILFFYWLIKKR